MITRILSGGEAFYRVLTPQWSDKPLSGMGAAKKGGRFNRPGQEALYLSVEQKTALAEYQQDNPWLPPGTICTYFVGKLGVADLSRGYDPAHWSPEWADYAIDWRQELFHFRREPITWLLGDLVIEAGLSGLLFPSQAAPGGTNLVLYNSSNCNPDELKVHDPKSLLPKNQDSWAAPA